jgi:glutamate dehydrogenase
VFPRSAKSITLTPEMRRCLGVEDEALPPDALIRALLRSPVDLLFNGGVGTFVKATTESHAEVGDRMNDGIRVDAAELRCRVVAEGGNLGLTQRARVEFAMNGGLVNSDAIDNSAGVDCSDHEVNIKILLGHAVADGSITEDERNRHLREMTGEVAALVLRDNFLQNQALVRNSAWGAQAGPARLLALQSLEVAGLLDRELEQLPSDQELNLRRESGADLTVPELAVLLGHCKIVLYDELLASDVPDEAALQRELDWYFPTRVNGRFGRYIDEHPLRRAIVANALTNDFFNHVEITLPTRLRSQTDRSWTDVLRAYVAAREVLELRSLWDQLEQLGTSLSVPRQTELAGTVNGALEWVTRWLLRRSPNAVDVAYLVDRYADATGEMVSNLRDLLPLGAQARYDEIADSLLSEGVAKELIQPLAGSREMLAVPDAVELALTANVAVPVAGRILFDIAERLELAWILDRIEGCAATTEWEMRALVDYQEELFEQQRALSAMVLGRSGLVLDPSDRVQTWLAANSAAVDRWAAFISRIRAGDPSADLVTIGVAIRQLATFVEGLGSSPPAQVRPGWD